MLYMLSRCVLRKLSNIYYGNFCPRDRDRQRQRQRETERETEKDRDRETETERHRERLHQNPNENDDHSYQAIRIWEKNNIYLLYQYYKNLFFTYFLADSAFFHKFRNFET